MLGQGYRSMILLNAHPKIGRQLRIAGANVSMREKNSTRHDVTKAG